MYLNKAKVISGKSNFKITPNHLNILSNLNSFFEKFNMASYPDFIIMS